MRLLRDNLDDVPPGQSIHLQDDFAYDEEFDKTG